VECTLQIKLTFNISF